MTETGATSAGPLHGAAARRARWAVATAFFVNGAAFASWVSRIPALRASLQLTDGALGSVLFALSMGVLLSFPLASKGAQWLGARQLSLFAGLLTLVLLPMPFMIGIVPSLVLVLLEMGIANGMMQVSMNVLAADVQARVGRPIMSSLHGLWSAGGLVGAGLGSVAAKAGFAPWLHLSLVALALGVALVASAVASRGVFPRSVQPLPPPSQPSLGPRRWAGLDRVLVGLGVICFCSFLTEGALADWSAVYLRDTADASESVAALGYAVFAGAMTGMRLLGDLLLARLGMARMLRAFNALGAVALAVALLLARVDAAMVAFVVMGFGLATVVPSAYSAAARHADDVARRDGDAAHPARAIALISGFGYTGLLVGPPVVGWLAQAAGLGHALFLLVLLTAVIAVLVPLLDRRAAARPRAGDRARKAAVAR